MGTFNKTCAGLLGALEVYSGLELLAGIAEGVALSGGFKTFTSITVGNLVADYNQNFCTGAENAINSATTPPPYDAGAQTRRLRWP